MSDGDIFYTKDPASISASPGFTWGRSGNCPANTWLLNDTVPSNTAGRRNFLNNARIIRVFVSNENINTFDIGVYEHTGGAHSLLGTVSIVAARGADFAVNLAVTTGSELALRVLSGSAKNVQAGLIMTGNLS